MNKAEQFFYDNAGYSYDPKTETAEQGRERCAIALAAAESFALENGFAFKWEFDTDIDSSDWDDSLEPWKTHACTMYSSEGEIVGHLGGIDFGRDGTPYTDSYRRVVEAELALQGLEPFVA